MTEGFPKSKNEASTRTAGLTLVDRISRSTCMESAYDVGLPGVLFGEFKENNAGEPGVHALRWIGNLEFSSFEDSLSHLSQIILGKPIDFDANDPWVKVKRFSENLETLIMCESSYDLEKEAEFECYRNELNGFMQKAPSRRIAYSYEVSDPNSNKFFGLEIGKGPFFPAEITLRGPDEAFVSEGTMQWAIDSHHKAGNFQGRARDIAFAIFQRSNTGKL